MFFEKGQPKLEVEIADTPSKQAQGLMFRTSLSDNAGMLFKFQYPNILHFWGENTYIPLDIAFISHNGQISKIDSIKPLSSKSVSSDVDCVMAIEANEGFFQKNGIEVGYAIKVDKEKGDMDHLGPITIYFEK